MAAQPLPNVLPAVDPLLLCGLRNSRTPLCSWGFALPTRVLPGIELQSFRLCTAPVYRVLMEFKPSPFSFLPFLSSPLCALSFLSSCFAGGGRGMLSRIPPVSVLSPQAKKLLAIPGFSLPPVHLSTPCFCQVLWFRLCRLLC